MFKCHLSTQKIRTNFVIYYYIIIYYSAPIINIKSKFFGREGILLAAMTLIIYIVLSGFRDSACRLQYVIS